MPRDKVNPVRVSKSSRAWAAKYIDRRQEYQALDQAIDVLLKQRSLIANELTHMREFMTAGQQAALVEELKARGLDK